MEDSIKFHLCEETPCPVQDRELFEILQAGFKTEYTNA